MVYDILDLENAIMQSYYETFGRVIKYADEATKRVLASFFEKHEADCLKSLLRVALTKKAAQKSLDYVVPVGRFTPEVCRRAASVSDPREVAALAWDDALREGILERLPECENLDSSLPAEAVIERYVFEKIWDAVGGLGGIDRKNAQMLVGCEIDAMNMTILVRSLYLGVSQEITRSFLIPIRFRIGNELDSALGSSNPFEAMRTLSRGPYRIDSEIISESEISKSTQPWELALRRMVARESSSIFLGYPLQVAIPLAFLNLKFFEIGDIRTILVGKKAEAVASAITSNLTMYYLR